MHQKPSVGRALLGSTRGSSERSPDPVAEFEEGTAARRTMQEKRGRGKGQAEKVPYRHFFFLVIILGALEMLQLGTLIASCRLHLLQMNPVSAAAAYRSASVSRDCRYTVPQQSLQCSIFQHELDRD